MSLNPFPGHGPGSPALPQRCVLCGAPSVSALTVPALPSVETPIRLLFCEWFQLKRTIDGGSGLPEAVLEASLEAMNVLEERIRQEPITSIEDMASKVAALTWFGEYTLAPALQDELAGYASSISATARYA